MASVIAGAGVISADLCGAFAVYHLGARTGRGNTLCGADFIGYLGYLDDAVNGYDRHHGKGNAAIAALGRKTQPGEPDDIDDDPLYPLTGRPLSGIARGATGARS